MMDSPILIAKLDAHHEVGTTVGTYYMRSTNQGHRIAIWRDEERAVSVPPWVLMHLLGAMGFNLVSKQAATKDEHLRDLTLQFIKAVEDWKK